MSPISQKTRDNIFRAGVALLIGGGALALWAYQDFDKLPNYLRIASLIPVMSSYAMLQVDQYRDWASVQGIDRVHAIGALLAPPLLLIGSLIWLFAAPDAHA